MPSILLEERSTATALSALGKRAGGGADSPPPGQIAQLFLGFHREAVTRDFVFEQIEAAVAAKEGVDAGRDRRIYEIFELRVDRRQLVTEPGCMPEHVFLVIVLSPPETIDRADFGVDPLAETRLHLFAHPPRRGQLIGVGAEDGGAVLRAPGRPGRPVAFEEDPQDLIEADDGRVEVDLQRFGMAFEVVVGGLRNRAAAIPNPSAPDAGKTPKLGVGMPESA